MYKVYLDEQLMYHPNVTDRLPLEKAKTELELNKAGTFAFTIRKKNPQYSRIRRMKSIVKIYDDTYRLFRGRVLNTRRGFYNELQVTCEGELAFFMDSVLRPYTFSGSVKEYFAFLVGQHNDQMKDEEKKFLVGRCTVTDSNDYIVRENAKAVKTLVEMREKLIGMLGGYFWFRETKEGVYIDYLEDFDTLNSQKVVFGENLLKFEELIKGQEIATAIVPLGAKLKDDNGNELDERLTIKSVNNGVDYVYSPEAVETYGWIFKTVEYDDITLPNNLLSNSYEELQRSIHPSQTIDLDAVDLHALNLQIQSFRLGNYTFVESKPHDFYDQFLTRKLGINILKPSDSNLSLGDERKTFVDKQAATQLLASQVNGKFGNLRNQYLHIRYSASADGTDMTGTSTDSTRYIGTCVTTSKEAPTNPAAYTWTLVKGNPGVGIASITEYYLATSISSGITIGSEGWTAEVQDVTLEKKYLWNYEKITYTDGTAIGTQPCIIGAYGDTGVGISGIANLYLTTNISSDVTKNTFGWTETVQNVSNDKKYLWNYERVTYTDGSVKETEPCIIGVYGDKGNDGVGIASITEYYLASASASGVTTSTSGWTTGIQTTTTEKKYLWNYEIVTYTDNTRYTSTPVIIGTYGDKGTDGVGVKSIATEYYLSSSKTTQADGSWQTSAPAWSAGMYMWVRSAVAYTDGTVKYTEPYCDSSWEATNDLRQELTEVIENSATEVQKTNEAYTIDAMKNYVEKSTYETFVKNTNASLEVNAKGLETKVSQLTEEIKRVDGDLQYKYNLITKYMSFDINGLTIGKADSPYKVVIDNDKYSTLVNGVEVQWVDAVTGEVHTPDVKITRKMDLLGYVTEMDEEGRVNERWAGDE